MIELIRQSAVPANLMRTAAKGALALPAGEMIEVLVYLAGTPLFGEQARMTLAGWDEASSLAAAADPQTPAEVLAYFIHPSNLRPALLPALLENAAVNEASLAELAHTAKPDVIAIILKSARVRSSAGILHALRSNPALSDAQIAQIDSDLHELGEAGAAVQEAATAPDEADEVLREFIAQHAAEIAAEEGKKFELVGGVDDVLEGLASLEGAKPAPAAGDAAAVAVSAPAPAAAVDTPAPVEKKERERVSVVQKIARMKVGDRVQLAMKGNKDERFVLIRDGSKIVSLAVLESPKISDQEVEMFASLKNVQEDVLRGIARKRRFIRSYAVVRNLVNNPRTPLDLALGFVHHLLVNDLKNLSMNKNISETIRKLALKNFREKASGGKKGD